MFWRCFLLPVEVKREAVLQRQSEEINDKLENVKVVILGAGGLGSNAAHMLARLGVGSLIIYDFDIVEPSNLNRQHYGVSDIGKMKAETTAERIKELLPYVDIEPRNELVDENVLSSVYEEGDIFIEAFDTVSSKVMAYDFFAGREKPYICTTGVAGPSGELSRRDLGHIHVVGDFQGEDRNDCYIPKVMAIAAMECSVVLELILKKEY
ncbi:thiamine biosynthesis protein ThiF [Aedoeadaptatus nemausensis]|uniref:Thiamine biosynthesis protein ThiF n=1 Tax=Aedoeadaptatus nemausensis TaxID=2582829 RepID=A0A6V6Y492_9FIRM|nr:thiamine biosynthesis protein ThiF [Peptoniphilus nemausensis]